LKQANEIESAWMEKNRDLYDKCGKAEGEKEDLKKNLYVST